MITIMLNNLGYTVISELNPLNAIKTIESYVGEIDLLITDVVMPEMNGRDLSNKVTEVFPNIKCLYMSGYTSNVIANNGIIRGELNFIQKPFSRNEFSSKIRLILDKE